MMFQKLGSMKSALRAVTAAAVLGGTSIGAMACAVEPYIGSVCSVAFNFCPSGSPEYLPADGRLLEITKYGALFSLLGTRYGGDGRTNFGLPDLRGRTVVATTQLTPPFVKMLPALHPKEIVSVAMGQRLGQAVVTLTADQIPLLPIKVPVDAFTGTATMNLSGGSVSGQMITGKVTVEGLNGDAAPTGGVNIPTATANTVGKNNLSLQFYPSGTTKIALPSSHDLGVTAGTISGTATGTVTMPTKDVSIKDAAGTVSPTAIPTMQPSLGLLQCIATQGIFPPRP